MTDHSQAGGAELRALVQSLDGPSSLSFRRPSTPPADSAPCAAPAPRPHVSEPDPEPSEPGDAKASHSGRKVIRTTCAGCGARFGRAGRAHRAYCGNTCRGRASRLRALQREADRPALPRVARERLAELRGERKATPALFPREEGRR